MLSMTINRVKVDAGPLITRFKDAEGTLGVILVGLTLHMVFSMCTGAVLAVINAPWYLTLMLILCECIIAYLVIKPLMDQAKDRFHYGSDQN